MTADPVGRLLVAIGPRRGPNYPVMGTVGALDPLSVELDTGQQLTTPAAGHDSDPIFSADFTIHQRVLAIPFQGGHDYLVQPHEEPDL